MTAPGEIKTTTWMSKKCCFPSIFIQFLATLFALRVKKSFKGLRGDLKELFGQNYYKEIRNKSVVVNKNNHQ